MCRGSSAGVNQDWRSVIEGEGRKKNDCFRVDVCERESVGWWVRDFRGVLLFMI